MAPFVMEYAGAGYTWYLFRDTPHMPVVALMPAGRSGRPSLQSMSVIPSARENNGDGRFFERPKVMICELKSRDPGN